MKIALVALFKEQEGATPEEAAKNASIHIEGPA